MVGTEGVMGERGAKGPKGEMGTKGDAGKGGVDGKNDVDKMTEAEIAKVVRRPWERSSWARTGRTEPWDFPAPPEQVRTNELSECMN